MNIYDFSCKSNNGEMISLSKYKGKVLLIVNTATHCGFTPTYKALEELYEAYKPLGLEILDFPCNQFGGQAPESDGDINKFCTLKYKTSFPRFAKIEVNGENQDPLYKYLESVFPFEGFDLNPLTHILKSINKKADQDYASKPSIKWNFTKFLLDKEGRPVARFEPTASKKKIEKSLMALLGKAPKVQRETKEEKLPEISELSLATLNGCPHCAKAKKILADYGVVYKEISWDDPLGEKIIDSLKIKLVPVLLVPTSHGLRQVHLEDDIEKWVKENYPKK
jgi:glutathione peroxidase